MAQVSNDVLLLSQIVGPISLTAGASYTIDIADAQYYQITGDGATPITLPFLNVEAKGVEMLFVRPAGTGNATITDHAGTTVAVLAAGKAVHLTADGNGGWVAFRWTVDADPTA